MDHPENDGKYKGLKVNSGVTSAPTVNPYLREMRKQTRSFTTHEFVEGILRGDTSIFLTISASS